MRYLKKDYFTIRLNELKKKLILTDGNYMASDKKLINLIFRGYSNSQINDLVREQFDMWDKPLYWQVQKSLRIRDYSRDIYSPKYKQLLSENINN